MNTIGTEYYSIIGIKYSPISTNDNVGLFDLGLRYLWLLNC